MIKADRVGNAELFGLSAKSLRRFVDSFSDAERKEFLKVATMRWKFIGDRPRDLLRFEHLTPDFLTTYEQWIQHYGNLRNTYYHSPEFFAPIYKNSCRVNNDPECRTHSELLKVRPYLRRSRQEQIGSTLAARIINTRNALAESLQIVASV